MKLAAGHTGVELLSQGINKDYRENMTEHDVDVYGGLRDVVFCLCYDFVNV